MVMNIAREDYISKRRFVQLRCLQNIILHALRINYELDSTFCSDTLIMQLKEPHVFLVNQF